MTSKVQILEAPRGLASLDETGVKPGSRLGSPPLFAPHGVSAAAHHPDTQPPCMQLYFLSFFFFFPSHFRRQVSFEEGYGNYYTGESQQRLPWAVLKPMQRELALPFAAGAPAKTADPLWGFSFEVAAHKRK